MFLDFAHLGELPDIAKIKNCLEQIVNLGDRIGAPIIDIKPKLAETIQQLSIAMFCYHKQKANTFTVCNNKRLKKMIIEEDADGFKEEDQFYLESFFRENLLETYTELIARSYLLKKVQKKQPNDKLYCISIFSRYSSEEHTVFFTETNGGFYVFQDNITDIKLLDYVEDYFSGRTNDIDSHIKTILQELLVKVSSGTKSFVERQKEVTESFKLINSYIKDKYDFISGAITFLDFLAWKGLWQSEKRGDALKVVSQLIDDFRYQLNKLSEETFPQSEIPLSKLISISDTIAIFTPKVSTITECDLMELHAKLSKYILESCVKEGYPIRGAIAYGEYNIMDNIMIGPGIDECASWHETGNWIGVHFTPTAQMYWHEKCKETSDSGVLHCPEIPMKNGLSAEYCIKWDVEKSVFRKLTLETRALLPEISGKYTNTYKFLSKCIWKGEKENGEK